MKKYDNIQLLRVIACLGVFVTHLVPKMGITGVWGAIANFGASGVYLFFMISGYLACASSDIAPQKGVKSWISYYVKRVFRILPLYYAVIIYNILLHEVLLRDVPADPQGLGWLRYFFLTNAFIPAPSNFWGNLSGTWTISIFCFFYVLAPIFRRLVKNFKGAVILYAALLLLRYGWVMAGLSDYMMPFYYLHFFGLGMVLFYGQKEEKQRICLIVFTLFAAVGRIPFFYERLDYFLWLSWLFTLAILFTEKLLLREGKAKKTVAVLDKYSFTIYLIHSVIIEGIEMVIAKFPMNMWAVAVITIGLTVVGCLAAYRLIEEPCGKLGKKLVKRLGT